MKEAATIRPPTDQTIFEKYENGTSEQVDFQAVLSEKKDYLLCCPLYFSSDSLANRPLSDTPPKDLLDRPGRFAGRLANGSEPERAHSQT